MGNIVRGVVDNIVRGCRGQHRDSVSWGTSWVTSLGCVVGNVVGYIVEYIVRVRRGFPSSETFWVLST